MSLNFNINLPAHNNYGPMPDPITTTPAQFYLIQIPNQGGQGTQGTQGGQVTTQPAVMPHPHQHLINRAAQLRRSLLAQWSLDQEARRRAAARHPRQQHRGNTCTPGRRVPKIQRRRAQARQLEDSLERYGTSDPKVLILKADVSVLRDILCALKPAQVQAMYDLAVDLNKTAEGVPAHVAGIFNMVMRKVVGTPL